MDKRGINVWHVGTLRYQTELAANSLNQRQIDEAIQRWPQVHNPAVKEVDILGACDQGLIVYTDRRTDVPTWIPWDDIRQLLGQIPMDVDLSGGSRPN